MTAAVGVTGCAVVVYVVSLSSKQHKRHTAIGMPMMQPRPSKPREIDNDIALPREEMKCY